MAKVVVTNIKGSSFLIETDDTVEIPMSFNSGNNSNKSSDFVEVSNIDAISEELNGVKRLIANCCNSLHEAFMSIPEPSKCSIEFGVKLTGELGIPMVTKSTGEANFKVSIEWQKK